MERQPATRSERTGRYARTAFALPVIAVLLLAGCTGLAPTPTQGGDQGGNTIYFASGTTEAEPYLVPLLTIGRDVLAEQNITLEYIALSDDQAVQAALDSGRVDVAFTGSLALQRAHRAGLGGQFVSGLLQHYPFVLTVPADVTDLSQLAGMRVGRQDPASLSVGEQLIRLETDLEPGVDYELITLAGSSNRASALLSGSLDAADLFRAVAAELEEESEGELRIYGGLWTALDPMLWEGFAASDEFRANSELASAFVAAVIETNRRFYAGDPAEMAARKDEIPEAEALDVEALADDFEQYQEIRIFPEDGGLSQTAYDGITNFFIDAGLFAEDERVPFEDLIDTSFVEAVQGQ